MDYETFMTRFPSAELLATFGMYEADFKQQYIERFNRSGLTSVGLTDVSIGKLVESGAVKTGRSGKMKIVPEKLDIGPLFRREIEEEFRGFLHPIVSTVHMMQDGHIPLANISVSAKGDITYGNTTIEAIKLCNALSRTPETIVRVFADIHTILKEDPLVWDYIGTLTAKEDGSLICEPNPESSVARLPPLGRPRHPPMPR